MRHGLTENGGKASVCGCSSMVEQKLPKLRASAKNSTSLSKTPHETSVSLQTLGISAQNIWARPVAAERALPNDRGGSNG